MKVLVVGGGGREHALVKKIYENHHVETIFAAPGNYGISHEAYCVDIKDDDIEKLVDFAHTKGIDLTIVGPEKPLSLGIVDAFEAQGLPIFGPSQEAARLETSKWFAKQLMKDYNIPTGKAEFFAPGAGKSVWDQACDFIETMSPPYVVKADGLYAGKGVTVTREEEEAKAAAERLLSENMGVLVEEYLEGEELSLLALTDGEKCIPLIPSQDYKRVYDNDEGPNTGGMGAYAPVPFVEQENIDYIKNTILDPTLKAMRDRGTPYKGVLYGGLILTEEGPKVLEFNARFGDPESQAILPLIDSDLLVPITQVAQGQLSVTELEWKSLSAVCVVLASQGYPGKYHKGFTLEIPSALFNQSDLYIYYAGVKSASHILEQGGSRPVTAGGRVLNVTGLGEDFKQARDMAYRAAEEIEFQGKHYRTDIALKTLK